MGVPWLTLALALALLVCPATGRAEQRDTELERGIALVQQGEYAEAIIVLDGVARRLAEDPRRGHEAAQAYLHLGIAHVGEGQEALARASFREAAGRDPNLVLSAFDVSPKVRELFQQAKDDLTHEAAAASVVAPEKKGGSKLPLVLVGVGGAAAVGVAVAGSSGGGGEGDTGLPANARVQLGLDRPDVVPLVGLEVLFTATTQNVDVHGTSWLWDFGDGATSNENGVGRHRYSAPGTYSVVLTVSSGRSTTARLDVTVRSLTGVWDGQDNETGDTFVVQMTQNGTNVIGDVDGFGLNGVVDDQRVLALFPFCGNVWEGTVSNDATRIVGRGGLPCSGRVTAQTLVLRQ